MKRIRIVKRVTALIAAIVVAITTFTLMPSVSYAKLKTKRTYDVYLPQKQFDVSTEHHIVSAQSSDETIASIGEIGKYSNVANIYPKKSGTVTITLMDEYKKKGKRKNTTYEYTLNVKDSPADKFVTEFVPVYTTKKYSDRYQLSLINNSDMTFEKVSYHYTLFDVDGNQVDEGDIDLRLVYRNFKSYSSPIYVKKDKHVDMSKTRLELTNLSCFKYKDKKYPEENYAVHSKVVEENGKKKVKITRIDNYGDSRADILVQVIFRYADGRTIVGCSSYVTFAHKAKIRKLITFPTTGWESYEIITYGCDQMAAFKN